MQGSSEWLADVFPDIRVQIKYCSLKAFWSAFDDVNYLPEVTYFYSGTDKPAPKPENLRFRMTPSLPPGVVFDPFTGAITGSPLVERTIETQYLVEATLDGRDPLLPSLGWSAFNFTVLPTELVQIIEGALNKEQVLTSEHPALPE